MLILGAFRQSVSHDHALSRYIYPSLVFLQNVIALHVDSLLGAVAPLSTSHHEEYSQSRYNFCCLLYCLASPATLICQEYIISGARA